MLDIANAVIFRLDGKRRQLKGSGMRLFIFQKYGGLPRSVPGPCFDVFNAAIGRFGQFVFGLMGKLDLFPLNAWPPRFILPWFKKGLVV